ncbi:hypothetical protein HMPREF0863_04224 [Erysipelotrichaceae bacterium 5_2_54FAA]|nr:hypothetical protein HMPREF0863_04224 [Erysipelotrichaceae bacterium 5_2_54FAA]
MKTRRRKIMRKIMSIMLLFVLLLTPIQANSGRINIQLKDLPGDWDEKAGVVFTLYQVGKMSDDGKAELDAKYDMSLPSDAQGLQKIAKSLPHKKGKSSSKRRRPIRMAVCLLRMSKMASIFLYPLIWKPMEVSILLS